MRTFVKMTNPTLQEKTDNQSVHRCLHSCRTLKDDVIPSQGTDSQTMEGSLPTKVHKLEANSLPEMPNRLANDFITIPTHPLARPNVRPAETTPENICEQEADQVADQVVRMSEPPWQGSVGQRALPPQAQTDAMGEAATNSAMRGGRPLTAKTRAFFEPRFGHDFSQVRVHTDAAAVESAQRQKAFAYTIGRDIAFNQGQYAPDSVTGKKLLAHELTHVLQQRGASHFVQRKPVGTPPRITPVNQAGTTALGDLFVMSMWQGQLDLLADAQRQYRYHLLALECLRVAKGPGADPVRLADFCRKWKIPLTMPFIGPVALIRSIGKTIGGWPSKIAIFDPTNAINIGIQVIGAMGTFLGRIQMQNALLVATDEGVVDPVDQSEVGSIIESCNTPIKLLLQTIKSGKNLEKAWEETKTMARKIERARAKAGLTETITP